MRGALLILAAGDQGHGNYLVYNYTSPLDGPDEPWGVALLSGPTLIYRTTLTFPAGS